MSKKLEYRIYLIKGEFFLGGGSGSGGKGNICEYWSEDEVVLLAIWQNFQRYVVTFLKNVMTIQSLFHNVIF